jgi:CRP-like cAMP-binding protein
VAKRKQVLFTQGEDAYKIYFIRSGVVKLLRRQRLTTDAESDEEQQSPLIAMGP